MEYMSISIIFKATYGVHPLSPMFVKVFEARLIIINKYKIYHCDPQVHRYESLAIVDVRSWDNGMCYFILFYDA